MIFAWDRHQAVVENQNYPQNNIEKQSILQGTQIETEHFKSGWEINALIWT